MYNASNRWIDTASRVSFRNGMKFLKMKHTKKMNRNQKQTKKSVAIQLVVRALLTRYIMYNIYRSAREAILTKKKSSLYNTQTHYYVMMIPITLRFFIFVRHNQHKYKFSLASIATTL